MAKNANSMPRPGDSAIKMWGLHLVRNAKCNGLFTRSQTTIVSRTLRSVRFQLMNFSANRVAVCVACGAALAWSAVSDRAQAVEIAGPWVT